MVATQRLRSFSRHAGRYDGKNNFFLPGTMFEVERRGTHLFMKWSTGAEVRLTPQPGGRFFDRTFWAFVRFEGEPGKPSSKLIWNFSGEDYEAGRVRE
jgi:hypothetical protein